MSCVTFEGQVSGVSCQVSHVIFFFFFFFLFLYGLVLLVGVRFFINGVYSVQFLSCITAEHYACPDFKGLPSHNNIVL